MPIPSDPFSVAASSPFVILILCVFFLLRLRWWLTRRGFRPSDRSLGNAFQEIQAKAIPQIEYALEEQRKEKTAEDDEGGPADPGRYYRRKMNQVDDLKK
jgi:hypothetical protein